MEGTYPIYFGDERNGQARVTRRGLYYHFSCQLRLTGETLCRVEVTCGDQTENLGVPVPEGKIFVLTKTVPISRFGNGNPKFSVLPKYQSVQGKFIPLHPEEPFAYLSRIKDAYLQRRGEQIGIVIKE